ncbi:ComF family protein [Streptomyces sp. NPDC005209]|uniref:ComF family protein n=1 Tax=Streptomyces sp. NPDC005209 TaxID=3156715 RepID=UPI0033AD0AD1
MGTVVGMRGWWQDLTDLVLPAECGGCGTPRTVLCPECRAALSGAAPCRARPVPEPPGLPMVQAAAPYVDEVRAILLAHKERGALALAGPLGTALAGAVRAGLQGPGGCGGGAGRREHGTATGPAGRYALGIAAPIVPAGAAGAAGVVGAAGAAGAAGVAGARVVALGDGRARCVSSRDDGVGGGIGDAPVLLVPVPSARRAVRARGHDPVRRIALAAAGELRRTGTPARVVAALRQRRVVADQSGLDSRQRLANLTGALEVAPGGVRLLRGGHVVLVDDLMTTGASLTEAARALWEAAGPDGGTTAVYARATREGREEPTAGSTGERDNGVRCAAVVAAPPDSFEINRN